MSVGDGIINISCTFDISEFGDSDALSARVEHAIQVRGSDDKAEIDKATSVVPASRLGYISLSIEFHRLCRYWEYTTIHLRWLVLLQSPPNQRNFPESSIVDSVDFDSIDWRQTPILRLVRRPLFQPVSPCSCQTL